MNNINKLSHSKCEIIVFLAYNSFNIHCLHVLILLAENRFSTSQTLLSVFTYRWSSTVFSIIVGTARDEIVVFEALNFLHISIFYWFQVTGSTTPISRLWLDMTRLSFQSPARLKHTQCVNPGLRVRTMNLPHQLGKISL